MKHLIKEAKRMQQLAGILKEDLDKSPVDTLIDAFLAKVGLTLTPEERAKFANAIEMDYQGDDISKATMQDLNDIFGASGIRSVEDIIENHEDALLAALKARQANPEDEEAYYDVQNHLKAIANELGLDSSVITMEDEMYSGNVPAEEAMQYTKEMFNDWVQDTM